MYVKERRIGLKMGISMSMAEVAPGSYSVPVPTHVTTGLPGVAIVPPTVAGKLAARQAGPVHAHPWGGWQPFAGNK